LDRSISGDRQTESPGKIGRLPEGRELWLRFQSFVSQQKVNQAPGPRRRRFRNAVTLTVTGKTALPFPPGMLPIRRLAFFDKPRRS
jgi:hypothetical protein